MLQFKYVTPVKSGDTITATSHNDLATAFNQRILSGAGDAAWRIMWNAHSLVRQVRNPAGDMLLPGTQQWPASDEWWKMYALVDNNNRCGEHNDAWYWPLTPPGEQEGANVANPLMAFIFGRDYINVRTRDFEPEANRLTNGPSDEDGSFIPIDVTQLTGNPDLDASITWTQAKTQRGIIERSVPFRASAPAYEAAHSAYSWRYPSTAPYLKTYPAFAPVPSVIGKCPSYFGSYPDAWQVKFTPLVPNYPPLAFSTCPGVSGHVQYVARMTDRYILYFQDAPPMMLPYTVYLEGPYDGGGALTRQHSELLTQAINKFVIELRGNYSERLDKDCFDIEGETFDFQRFFSHQYALAPASCGYVDNTGQLASYGYPTYTLSFSGVGSEQAIPANTLIPLTNGHPGDTDDKHSVPLPFVFSAYMVEVHNTLSNVELEFLDAADNPIHVGSNRLGECPLPGTDRLSVDVPSAVNGIKTIVGFLATAINPGSVRCRIKNNTGFTSGGSITVELLEQVSYLPDIQDAYAVLRCGTTNGSDEGPDTHGGVISKAKLRDLSTTYFRYGCITNPEGQLNIRMHESAANFNSIYESARQLITENLRMVPRTRINRYRTQDGNSELYFQRYALGNGPDNPQIQVIEEEVKPVVGTRVIEPLIETELKPYLEYVVRRDGNDNIKPTVHSDDSGALANKMFVIPKLPFTAYDHGVAETVTTYCDDFVMYGNVKYVPPGYNLAQVIGVQQTISYPDDRDNNYDHVIVGMPIPTYDISDQVPAGYIKLTADQDVKIVVRPAFTRLRSYVDAFGQPRTETVKAARIDWVSLTRYGKAGDAPDGRTTAWKNMVLHPTPQLGGDATLEPAGFHYQNGFRYAIQRRLWSSINSAWLDWETVAGGQAGDINTPNTYGFDATAGTALGNGTYFAEDPLGFEKTIGVDIEYRVVAKPVLDANHSNMVVHQRAHFTPVQMTWQGSPGKQYRVYRHQQKSGQAAEYVEVSDLLPADRGTYYFVDTPTTICPVRITTSRILEKDAYELHDQLLGYQVFTVTDEAQTLLHSWTLSQLQGLSPATFIVRPDNIIPTDFGDLFGGYETVGEPPYMLDNAGDPAFVTDGVERAPRCGPLASLRYKVYGANVSEGISGISFKAPYYDSETEPYGTQHLQTFEVYTGQTFCWVKDTHPAPVDYCQGQPFSCVNPWQPSPWNFFDVQQIWKATGQTSPGAAQYASQRARIFQYGRYVEGCNLQVIENVAGCEPGNYLGVFAYNPAEYTLSELRGFVRENEAWTEPSTDVHSFVLSAYNTLQEYEANYQTGYGDILIPSQWTPWSDSNPSSLSAENCPWYVLRTGYERLHLQTLTAPGPGTYSVRGYGFVTYKGVKYYAGENVSITADTLVFSISDHTTKLVTVTTVSCDTLLFDFFQGIAPGQDLGEAQLEVGVTYRVHKGKGITFTRRTSGVETTVSVSPGNTFTWGADDAGVIKLPANVASQIRAVEGIRHTNEVPRRGQSNEWCMFMSLNHYHPSISSIWKTDAYGDLMPFLHNRCHTYSAEIRGPKHAALSRHFAYSQFPPLVSEAPPGYTYLEDINFPYWPDRQMARDYFRSCQVYRPPYEILSAQIVYTAVSGADEDGNTKYDDSVVKLTIKGRLQATGSAPGTVDSAYDTAADKQAALRAEPYRTDENALREYLQHAQGGYHCQKGMIGDSATSFDIFSLPDDPMGACHPRFYFVKLIPHVYHSNDVAVDQKTDTLIRVDPYVQMDLYLRAMCGGWMDIESLRSASCDQGMSTSPVADYTYENLCYQACRSYGAYLDVTPEVWLGKNFLPLQSIVQYDFSFPEITDPLVMEYRSWQLDKCEWGPWLPYQGSINPAAEAPVIGGTGYNTTPTISLEPGLPSFIKYKELTTPVTLSPNTTYYLFSSETSGGDQWCDKYYTAGSTDALVYPSGIKDVFGARRSGSSTTTYPTENAILGPVSFRSRCVGCTHGNAITPVGELGDKLSNYTGKVGMKFTTGDSPITVYELGRILLPSNSQSHVLELMDSLYNVVASVTLSAVSALEDPSDISTYTAPQLRTVVTNGVITSIEIEKSGAGLDPSKLSQMRLYINSSSGTGAEAHVSEVYPYDYVFGPGDPEFAYHGGIKAIVIDDGGSGYASPVIVTLTNESFANPEEGKHSPAQAVASVGKFELKRLIVTAPGAGYEEGSTRVIISGGNGNGAQATAVITTGSVTDLVLSSRGTGYTSPPTVQILGLGTGATAIAELGLIPGEAGSVVAITVTPDTVDNYGYATAPDVQITGGDAGDSSASGAYAQARMRILDLNTNDGMQVVGFDVLPAPFDGLTSVSIPYNGPTITKTEFRFSLLADWPNGVKNPEAESVEGVTVLPSAHLFFHFLPDLPSAPHKYEIKRADFTYGTGCNRTPINWTTLTGGSGVSGPLCDNNSNHFIYDDCTTDCACLWPDPTDAHLAPLSAPLDSNDIVGSTYRIKDLTETGGTGTITSVGLDTGGQDYSSGTTATIAGGGGVGATVSLTISSGVITGITLTNAGSGYTQNPQIVFYDPAGTGSGASATAIADSKLVSYYLSWPMQPLVVYNIERRLFYRFDSDASWHTLASGVRSPYIDNAAWAESFSRNIVPVVERSFEASMPEQVIPATANSSETPRSFNITTSASNKNVYVTCTVVVTIPLDPGPGTTTIDYVLDQQVVYPTGNATTFTYTDDRVFPQWDGNIVSFKYQVKEQTEVSVTWPTVRNHRALVSNIQESKLTYELHRTYESEGAQVDELIAISKATSATAPDFVLDGDDSAITVVWEGWGDDDHLRLDDARANISMPPRPATVNSERYYVVVHWKDWPEVKCITDAQQNREQCTDPLPNVPCVNTNRQYRVEAVVDARNRWFTAMPMGVNIERPQGFSPVPNTCTYAEMFNNFAHAINRLQYARLELPFSKRMRTVTHSSLPSNFLDTPGLSDCRALSCGSSGTVRNVCPSGAKQVTYSEWSEIPISGSVGAGASLNGSGYSLDGCLTMIPSTYRFITEFGVDPDQEALAAIPRTLLGNFDLHGLALIGRRKDSFGNCRIRGGLTYSCAAEKCCSYPLYDSSRCTCRDSDNEPEYTASACDCGCALREDGGYARTECRTLYESQGQCALFTNGAISPPTLPCGDISWIGTTGGNATCIGGGSWASSTIEGIRSLVYMHFPLY